MATGKTDGTNGELAVPVKNAGGGEYGLVNDATDTYALVKNVGYCLVNLAASAVIRSRRIRKRFPILLLTAPGGTSSERRVSPCDSVKLRFISRGAISLIWEPITRMSSADSGKPQMFWMLSASAVALVNGAL